MKIRNGFVSNSSSSSFLVGFKTIPESEQEVTKLLFGSKKIFQYYDENYRTEDISEIIFRELKAGSPLSETEIQEELDSGYLGDEYCVDWHHVRADSVEKEFHKKFPGQEIRKDPEWSKKWSIALDEDFKEQRQKQRELTIKFWEEHKGQFDGAQVYRFHYSDNEGAIEGAMEHGGIFDALPHVRVSHH